MGENRQLLLQGYAEISSSTVVKFDLFVHTEVCLVDVNEVY